MPDTLTPRSRSERVGRVRGKNARPELVVRSKIRRMGFRSGLHASDLPGKPDIILRRLGKIDFVHGCFWRRHAKAACKFARLPKSRRDFWLPKLEANRLRDIEKLRLLRKLGWGVLVVWECEIRHKEQLENKLSRFLGKTT